MTLAAFARQMGLDPATVRQWKKRGKIVERDGGYVLRDDSVTGLDGLRLERDSSVTPECDKPIEELSRIEALERDNRILSDAVDSLRDLTTEQGMTIRRLTARIEALESAAPDAVVAKAWENALGKSNYTGSAASVGEQFHD